MDTKQEADMGVTKESFGFLEDKREAFLYTIENQNGFAVKVTDFGVNIVSLLVKNKEGNIKDVALGYDTLEEYFENGIMFGATVGRNVNRISNARFEIDGKEYHVAKNRGKHNIHSDKEHGFHKVLWDSEIIDDHAVKFTYVSPDGEQGFPGTLVTNIIYTVTETNGLIVSYHAVSDKKTLINLTNHNYFNLGGHESGTIENTKVRIYADEFTPINEDTIPTEALNLATSGRFDILTHTSPLPDGDYTIPTVNAFACITGMGEDQFFEDVVAALKSVGK